MDHCGKTFSILGLAVFLFLHTLSSAAHAAIAPLVNSLTPVTAGVSTPVRLASDAVGNIYLSDPRGGGILKYDNSGNLLQTFSSIRNVYGVAIAKNGDLLVSEGTSVAVLNPTTGALLSRFGTFLGSNGITIDTTGNIYVADSLNSCIQVFNASYAPVNITSAATGKPANSFGSFGRASGQFARPTGISFEKISGQLAIVDSLAGQIQYYSTTGIFQSSLGSFGAGPLMFTSPQSVAFEYSKDNKTLNRIYVVDSFQGNIQVIDAATGSFLSYIGGYGSAPGQLVTPGDLLFDRYDPLNNRLLVTNGSGTLSNFSIDMITGNCGSANNGAFLVAPTTNLCKNGFVSNFSGVGPWSWSCTGANGGTTATCSAAATSHQATVTVVATNGGSGSVTSNPGGINCLNGICSASFTPGSSVTLMPLASADSSFAGWTGDCSSAGTGNCTLVMSVDHTATATFNLIPKARVNGIPYGNLTKAYASINLAGIIEAQALTFIENLVLNLGSNVTFMGGYNPAYSARTGFSVLNGSLTVGTGSLTVDGLVIQ